MPTYTHTVKTPLPTPLTATTVTTYLHSHTHMMNLNPLIESYAPIPRGPTRCTPEEFAYSTWYKVTDRISYLPGVKGRVSYFVCFRDEERGVRTRCYAPLGLEIGNLWSVSGGGGVEVAGDEKGDAAQVQLVLTEECTFKCNALVSSFVRKNLRASHKTLVERLVAMAGRVEEEGDGFLQTSVALSRGNSVVVGDGLGSVYGDGLGSVHGDARKSVCSEVDGSYSPGLSSTYSPNFSHPFGRERASVSSSKRESLAVPKELRRPLDPVSPLLDTTWGITGVPAAREGKAGSMDFVAGLQSVPLELEGDRVPAELPG